MPTYGYKCNQCQFQFQVMQKMSDDPVKLCPECQGEVKRLLYPVGIVFKGTGWYVNDSRAPDKSETSENKPTEAGSETKSETESEVKAESKSETGGESRSEGTPAKEVASAPTPAASTPAKSTSETAKG